MPNPQHILVVSCLIRNPEQAILVVRHLKRGWELPQGRVEEGESLLEALNREILEETGVRISQPKLAAVWSKMTAPSAVIHGFVANYASGSPTPSDETPEVAWLSKEGALDLIEHPVNRDRLNDLLNYEDEVRFYSYTTGPYRRQADARS